jgi:phosphoserine phosphatase RsbU/P
MGIQPSVQYELGYATLEPGETLALFSDGVTEASTSAGDEFGEQGLARFLCAHKEKSCTETLKALVHHVRNWCGNASFADDFTTVLLRRH